VEVGQHNSSANVIASLQHSWTGLNHLKALLSGHWVALEVAVSRHDSFGDEAVQDGHH